ncbi:putative receptor-like protein kinase-like [Capsicum annuum]|nr:putative receptor-like protein kinase-like [Capsicum annuum]
MVFGKKYVDEDLDNRGFKAIGKEVEHLAATPNLGDFFPLVQLISRDSLAGSRIFQRVEIIAALLWMAFIRTSAAINGYLRPCLMDFPLNLRSKTSLPKVHNSMGNFRIDVPIKFTPEKTNMELHSIVILIRDTVNRIVASCAKASPDEIVSTLVNIYNESVRAPEWGGSTEVDKVLCSSMLDLKESYMQLFERDDGINALTFIRDANL